MLTRVSKGKELDREVVKLLERWQSPDPDTARGMKSEYVSNHFDEFLVDVDYWGQACHDLLQDFHNFIKDIYTKKDLIRVNTALDHEGKVKELKALGNGIESHYGTLDALFQKTLERLKTEEPEIDARLAKAAAAAEKASEKDRSVKKRALDLETTGTESDRASKRRNAQTNDTRVLSVQNDVTMDLDSD